MVIQTVLMILAWGEEKILRIGAIAVGHSEDGEATSIKILPEILPESLLMLTPGNGQDLIPTPIPGTLECRFWRPTGLVKKCPLFDRGGYRESWALQRGSINPLFNSPHFSTENMVFFLQLDLQF